jgi:hypothetical protein
LPGLDNGMDLNPYAKAPLYAAQVDPATGRHVRAYFFLGGVPRAVLEAARRCRGGAQDARRPEWTAADKEVLRRYYGSHWRGLLTPTDPDSERIGGSEFDFGDLSGFDKPGGPDVDRDDEDRDGENKDSSDHEAPSLTGSAPPTYTDIAVYPEDTVQELRLKLSLASGIAPYRQHLFYYAGGEGPEYPYRLSLDGAPFPTDWREIVRTLPKSPYDSKASKAETLAGFAVDTRLMERREGIYVRALDTFRLLGPSAGTRITRAYYVDLHRALPPLGVTARPNDGLAGILRDSMQFDILYYGAFIRWWPQLSPDAFSLAMTSPDKVGETYPALDPDPDSLKTRFGQERTLADRAAAWRLLPATGRQPVAVTAASVRFAPSSARMRVAIRNVFDWIPTSPSVAVIAARFEVDLNGLDEDQKEAAFAQATIPATRSGHVLVAAVKRHASSYGPRSAPAAGAFAARPPRRDAVAFALARGAESTYAKLLVQADGAYEVSAEWREHDRMGFSEVAKETQQAIGSLLAEIDAMGDAAFPIGGRLGRGDGHARGRGPDAALGAITASAFWPHALTAAGFRDLKAAFRVYEKAGIVGIRGLQQAGAYAFYFRKGVAAYDPLTADRATRGAARWSDTPGLVNQYAWLTDASASARWATTFQGRTVRVYHRATDLRIEVLGADSLAEFDLIRRYVFSFLDSFAKSTTGVIRSSNDRPPKESPGVEHHSHRLKRLQERDPVLFDLKRHDPDVTVYSVLCQSERQPHVYDEAETRDLSAQKRAKLTRYWNFTENTPAYYSCPNPRYSHLSFRAGQHPLGFCLPCCKKTSAPPGSRAALADKNCLRRRAWEPTAEEEAELASSRHVLSYGKAVPEDRVAEIARELSEGLFQGALPRPYRLQQVGVPQSVPAVSAAGYAFSLAYALAEGGETPDDVLTTLAGLAASMGDTFYALGDGSGAAFASAADLSDAILGAFVRREDTLSPFGPGGALAGAWPAMLADLARYAYGAEVVTLADPDGSGSVRLEAAPSAIAALTGPPPLPGLVLLMAGPAGTYPIAAMDPKFYMRVPPASRWMAARRVYRSDEAPTDDTIVDGVSKAVRDALAFYSRTATKNGVAPDLAVFARYARDAGAKFTVSARLADMHNRCYAVLLHRDGAAAYIPIEPAPYPVGGPPVSFGARPDVPLSKRVLDEAIADINEYIVRAKETCMPITRKTSLVDPTGSCIGFLAEGAQGLYYFHDASQLPTADSPIYFPYDSREIDQAIMGHGDPDGPRVTELANGAKSRNMLYRLFLAEFSAVLKSERNTALRDKLASMIKTTDFSSPASVRLLRQTLGGLLAGHPGDLATVRGIVKKAHEKDTASEDTILAAIDATTFEFDRMSLARLRALKTHKEIVVGLKKLLDTHVVAAPDGRQAASQNYYIACSSGVGAPAMRAHCSGRRLNVPAEKLDDFYDCLAADIRNPGKVGLLAAASAGVFEPLSFIRRPGEHLTIGPG